MQTKQLEDIEGLELYRQPRLQDTMEGLGAVQLTWFQVTERIGAIQKAQINATKGLEAV